MNSDENKIHALGLCSGGLDSILSALVLREQGVSAHWITFETPFFSAENARKASKMTGIPLMVENITPTYMKMLLDPPCGYGQHMNPCMDCHSLMFRLAGEKMESDGFNFLFSGEVLGQRPMSQTRPSLRYVEKHSGHDGYIVRPLCAQRMPETIPEKKGWVDRELLLDITGRSRKRQMRLAERFGIQDYPAPAGGCLLTDKGYCARLKDLFTHQKAYTENDLHMLKHGRHFRLPNGAKIIVGRTQADNRNILRWQDRTRDIRIHLRDHPGPTVIIPMGADEESIGRAAALCAGYGKVSRGQKAVVKIRTPDGEVEREVKAQSPEDYHPYLI
jgi:tRNA U34 2-thiouridine synthase MnmA/TrmU